LWRSRNAGGQIRRKAPERRVVLKRQKVRRMEGPAPGLPLGPFKYRETAFH